MKPVLFATLFLTFVFVLTATTPRAHAASGGKEVQTPATHMWILAGGNMIFVPAHSLQDCLTLISQAASLNSSTGKCYNGNLLLKKISCTKPVKENAEASCTLK